MEEREIGRVFDLASEWRNRKIEALPFEPRMTVERIMFTAEKDKQRADVQLEVFRQQALSGTLALHLRPEGAPQRRPSGRQHELDQYMKAAKQREDARIDGRANQRVDAILAMSRGRSETPEERLKARERALAAASRQLERHGRERDRER